MHDNTTRAREGSRPAVALAHHLAETDPLPAWGDVPPAEHEWGTRAICWGDDPRKWDIPDGAREPTRTRHVLAAIAICQECPVRLSCLRYQLDQEEGSYVISRDNAVWGGTTPERRRLMWTEHAASTASTTSRTPSNNPQAT